MRRLLVVVVASMVLLWPQPAGAGAGVYAWTGNWAQATEGYAFPRDASMPWARSTVVEVR